jgi:hypothetical protein
MSLPPAEVSVSAAFAAIDAPRETPPRTAATANETFEFIVSSPVPVKRPWALFPRHARFD